MTGKFDVFGAEIRTLEQAEAVLADPASAVTREQYQTLAAAYDKLLRSSQRLTRLSDRSEQRIKEANIRIEQQNQELAIARDRANAATQAKSRFLATMTHELRTPMNGVMGMLQVLMDSGLSDGQMQLADTAFRATQSLLQLVNDLLDHSKIEAGRIDLETIAFDPRRLATETLALVTPTAQGKGLNLETELDPALPVRLFGDPFRLRQVLLNLLGNAVKFTAQGGVTLAVTVLESPAGPEPGPGPESGAGPERCRLCLAVTDSGVGMTEAEAAGIFEEFSQADASTTRRFGGTGLGLSICRRLVALMGGRILVSSVPGAGSTFRVEVPFTLAPVDGSESADGPGAESAASSGAAASPGVVPDWAGRRILVADDNLVNRQVVAAMLRPTGCLVLGAEDGRAALEAVRGEWFDLVLMDMSMPVMDGPDSARAIRALGGAPPIIALSANLDQARHHDGPDGAPLFDDLVAKPILKNRLLAALAPYLGGPATFEPGSLQALADAVGRETCAELAGLHLAAIGRALAALPGLLAAGHFEAAERAAHDVKSSAAACGCTALSARARALEEACERRDRPAADAAAGTLAAPARAGLAAVERFLAAPTPASA
jgi:signal transduction histidine kinase/CheY-like chemotaxis protein/HPt (histidine-containing phosphotransfer) domain-containing protein